MMFAPADSPVHPAFRRWLLLVAGMIFVMVVVGGLTRLTESGLSMTEWRPIFGWLPPLSDESWRRIFDLYRETPQFKKIFPDMTVDGFKAIFWFEYLHRLLGRLIALVFFAGFVYLLVRRRIPRRLIPQLITLFVLGGLQGALGWYMVTSGLIDRPSVSHFRLAAHLSLAILLYVWIVWILSGLLEQRNSEVVIAGRMLPTMTYLSIAVTIVTGALVAGLDAGKIHNTFPLMGGTFVPTDYLRPDHGLSDFMSNPVAAQFNHRVLAIVTVVLVVMLWWRSRQFGERIGRRANWMVAAVIVQAGLGMATLLLHVPIWLATLHQVGAMILMTTAVLHARSVIGTRKGNPAVSEQMAR